MQTNEMQSGAAANLSVECLLLFFDERHLIHAKLAIEENPYRFFERLEDFTRVKPDWIA